MQYCMTVGVSDHSTAGPHLMTQLTFAFDIPESVIEITTDDAAACRAAIADLTGPGLVLKGLTIRIRTDGLPHWLAPVSAADLRAALDALIPLAADRAEDLSELADEDGPDGRHDDADAAWQAVETARALLASTGPSIIPISTSDKRVSVEIVHPVPAGWDAV